MSKKHYATFLGMLLGSILFVGAGCGAPQVTPDTSKQEQDKIKMDSKGTMPESEDMMMDDSHMTAVVMQQGQMMTEWEGGDMMKMEHDVMLKDGTKIMMDGTEVKKDGTKMMLKDGQRIEVKGQLDAEGMMNDGAMNKPRATGENMADSMMKDVGSYEPYDQSKLALAKTGPVVLFFHAAWCPDCRAIEKDILSSSIPKGLTILKVDYDSSQELKKKYGVTIQHTFVKVDSDGKMLKKWSGGLSLAEIVKQL
jgi:thiol-disulfide isomerase/thioredoxin